MHRSLMLLCTYELVLFECLRVCLRVHVNARAHFPIIWIFAKRLRAFYHCVAQPLESGLAFQIVFL